MAERTNFPDPLNNGAPRNGTSNGLYYPSKVDAEGEEVSFHEVLEVLFKNKWIVLACFIGVLLGTAVYTLQQDPEYEAASTVYVNNQQSSPQLGELLGLDATSSYGRNIANEIEIIKSRKIASRVAELLIDYEYIPGTDKMLTVLDDPARESKATRLKVAERLQKRIRVEPLSRGVDIVEIRALSIIPEEAALISTLYAEEYAEYNRELSRLRMTASREFLDQMTDQYRGQLDLVTDSLMDFMSREGVVAPDQEAQQLLEQITELQTLQSQARLELGAAQAELRLLEEQLESVRPGLASQLASTDAQFVTQVGQRIAQLEIEIQQKYAANPQLRQDPSLDTDLQRKQKELSTLQEQLQQRSQNLADANGVADADAVGLLRQEIMQKRMQASALEARSELLNSEVGRVQGRLSDMPRKDYILRGLDRARNNTEELYAKLIESRQEAAIAEQSELGYVEVVDTAIVPDEPVRPRVQLNLLLGAVFGLLLGIGLAFVRNAVDSTIRKPEDVQKLGLSVVGLVPGMERHIRQDFNGEAAIVVDGRTYSTRLVALLNPLSPIAEGYRRVRTNLQFSRPDGAVRTLVVTSPGPSEGKTVTAMNLAVTVAQAGKRTLYIDADLRRPQGHSMLGLEREPGLVDLLFDAIPDNIEQFAAELDSYLYVIPAGRDVPNPAEVLGSHKMKKYLARWRQEFDMIIIDTPPTLIVADALILASDSDATMMVCSAGETNWQALGRCAEALEGVGANIVGVLLNRYDAKAAYGGYKYGYGYGYEYGYGTYYYHASTPPGRKGDRRLARRS